MFELTFILLEEVLLFRATLLPPVVTYVIRITKDVWKRNGFAATHSDSQQIPVRVVANIEHKVKWGDFFQSYYFGVWRKRV
jgi:hypothetical protein